MWKRIIILSIVCVFITAGVSIAEDRRPERNERDLHQQELQEARRHIEELRERAHEHEQEARQLLAQAEELERKVDHELEEREMAEHFEKMHQEIAKLNRRIVMANVMDEDPVKGHVRHSSIQLARVLLRWYSGKWQPKI